MRSSYIALFTAVACALLPTSSAATPQARPGISAACIALTLPSVQGVDGPATNFGIGVRDLFVSYLTGPSLKTVSLEARLASQAALEAREKGCERVLLVSVERKRSGGSKTGSILGQAAGIAVTRTPVGSGVTGTVASSAAWASGEAIYRFSSQIRAKDEIELSYRLGAPDVVERARPVSSKAKAKSDGEDVLTPLVEKAANGIVAAAAEAAK